jgi:hypothetical protein
MGRSATVQADLVHRVHSCSRMYVVSVEVRKTVRLFCDSLSDSFSTELTASPSSVLTTLHWSRIRSSIDARDSSTSSSIVGNWLMSANGNSTEQVSVPDRLVRIELQLHATWLGTYGLA